MLTQQVASEKAAVTAANDANLGGINNRRLPLQHVQRRVHAVLYIRSAYIVHRPQGIIRCTVQDVSQLGGVNT